MHAFDFGENLQLFIAGKQVNFPRLCNIAC
jgi:hypothetical protein